MTAVDRIRTELLDHERVIERGLSEFVRVGRDLLGAERDLGADAFAEYVAALGMDLGEVQRLLPLVKAALA